MLLPCRPEANFSSLEGLITRINQDGDVSKEALSRPELQAFASDSFLQPSGCCVAGQQQQQQGGCVSGGVGSLEGDAETAAVIDAADELVAVGASC